jgi:LysM repeat protein
MTTKRYYIFLVMVSLAMIFTGCKLSASTPPTTTETPDDQDRLATELANLATQTAVAGGGTAATPTQEPPTESTETTTGDTTPVDTPAATEPPEQPPPAEVFTPTQGIPTTYQLQKGEFPFCIARRFNVNQTELLNVNGLSSSSVVPVGFTLKIPQTGNTFFGQRALTKHPTNYTVVAGDTIYTVACKFGDVSPDAIAQVNGLKSPYNLSTGQVLNIP